MIETVGNNCVGCGACESACKAGAISLEANQEGFLYPVVDKERCVNCDLCDKACPALYSKQVTNIEDAEIHGVRAREEYNDEIIKSASAGVFYFIANYIIEQGGYVFGAAFDKDYSVKHICGRTKDDITRMQNSKYVQSDIRGVYNQIESILEKNSDAYVLFSGTPCQCVGLKAYLKKDYANLYIVDIVCHGVPSPLAFRKYLNYLQEARKEKVDDYQFRYKYKGWNYHGYMSSYVKFNNHFWPTVRDPYMSSFLKMYDYRDSCYTCTYNTTKKISDITLADFSGVRKIAPDFFTKSGCSEVFVHTQKGACLFKAIDKYIEHIPLSKDSLTGFHKILKNGRIRPKIRDDIYNGINELDDKAFVMNNLKKGVTSKGIIRFYTPFIIRRIVSKH